MVKNKRGIGLAGILMVTGILLAISAVLTAAALMGSRGVHQGDMAKQARYAAYSGMQVTMYQLIQDDTLDGDQGEVLMPDGYISYQVEITNNLTGSTVLNAPDGSEVPVGSVQIVSTGKAKDGTLQVNAGISGLAGRVDPTFAHAAVGTSRMYLQPGTLVDGWDSRLGPYVPYSPGAPQINAPIASNAYATSAVQVANGATLDGDIQLGPNASSSPVFLGASSDFTGAQDPQTTEFRVPRFVRPPGLIDQADVALTAGQTHTLTSGAYQNITVVGSAANPATLVVPSGKYFIQNMDMAHVDVVTSLNAANEPVEFYVDGNPISNPDYHHTILLETRINQAGKSEDFQMFFTSPKKNHKFRNKVTIGETQANAVMSGNKLDLTANSNSEIFGAVNGHTIRTTDSAIHYDQALSDVTFNADTGWSMDGVREDVDSDSVIGAVQHEDSCFIATAAYGSLLEPEVVTLRKFRDEWLLTNRPGQLFVETYYTVSPPIADFIAQRPTLRAAVRMALTPIVAAVKWPVHTALLLITIFGLVWRRRRAILAS